jgi:hypothetical protein
MFSEPPAEKYFQRVIPMIAAAAHRTMISQIFDFEESLLVVAPPPLAGALLGFAAKIGISFIYSPCLRLDVVEAERHG